MGECCSLVGWQQVLLYCQTAAEHLRLPSYILPLSYYYYEYVNINMGNVDNFIHSTKLQHYKH